MHIGNADGPDDSNQDNKHLRNHHNHIVLSQLSVKAPSDISCCRQDGSNQRQHQGLFPVCFDRVLEICPDKRMLIPRPVPGDIAQSCCKRPGNGNTGNQQEQHTEHRTVQHIPEIDVSVLEFIKLLFRNADFLFVLGHLFNKACIIVLFNQHQVAGGGQDIGKGKHDHQHRRQKDEHIQKINPAQCAQPCFECVPEQLAPVLRQIFFPEIAFSALPVIVVVHHSTKHVFLSPLQSVDTGFLLLMD